MIEEKKLQEAVETVRRALTFDTGTIAARHHTKGHAALALIKQELKEYKETLEALNELRSNVVATQSASWSNLMYPFVAILDAAGMEVFDPTEEQLAQHISCYGGAGGYPEHLQAEPNIEAYIIARNIQRRKEKSRT